MKVKRAAAVVLACTMLIGQVVYADEYEQEEYMEDVSLVDEYEHCTDEGGDEVYGVNLDISETEEVVLISGDRTTKEYEWDLETQYSLEIEDETICTASITTSTYSGKISVYMTAYRQGETNVYMLNSDGDRVRQIHVTVTPKAQVLYVDIPLEIGINTYAEDVRVIVEDETICTAEVSGSGYSHSMKLRGIQAGTTNLQILVGTGVFQEYVITVKGELPEDAVRFPDAALEAAILGNRNRYYDSETDRYVYICEKGYVSFEDLAKVTDLDLSFAGITDLTGLEYAVNIGSISLQYNEELEDISALQGCTKLHSINLNGDSKVSDISALFDKPLSSVQLEGTAVPFEDRLKLSGLPSDMCKGDQAKFTKVYGVWGTEVSMEEKDKAGYVQVDNDNATIIALKEGTTQIAVCWEGGEDLWNLTIAGVACEQETGEDFGEEVNIIRVYGAEEYESAILTENGALWKTYPAAKKVSGNAKKYVADWVYYSNNRTEAEMAEYWLDTGNSLWNENEKVMENVSKFDIGYALDQNGILRNLYRPEEKEIAQVADWTTIGNKNNGQAAGTRVLKEDGTLWERQEVRKDQPLNEFVKIADNVKAIQGNAYIQNDGTYYYEDANADFTMQGVSCFAETEIYAYRFNLCVTFENDGTYYYSTSGELHHLVVGWTWEPGGMKCDISDFSLGNVGKVKSVLERGSKIYFLNEEGDLYFCPDGKSAASLCAQNVEKLDYIGGDWIAKLEDGTYYMENGDVVEENSGIALSSGYVSSSQYGTRDYYVVTKKESGEKVATKNGVELLNAVKLVWTNETTGSAYALRTDGTVWNVTTIPTKIIDLAADDFMKGDVNENGEVDIQDLRMMLHYACDKTELTERQLKIADVDATGTVDIQDLRKVLRFVCGKINSLE